jgi:hypothetical protein
MKKAIVLIVLIAALAACASKPKVDVKRSEQETQTNSRSEPIFYNGKTYQLDYAYNPGQSLFDMKVSGLGPNNKQDAINIATSALGYYSCPSGKRGKLQGAPAYAGGKWDMKAMCG